MAIQKRTTQYSPVGPIKLLLDLQAKNALGNYLLLLAHEVLAHPQEYAQLSKKLHADADPAEAPFIIMDNSVIELGHSLSMSEIINAADIVAADVIMLPDVLGDCAGTMEAVSNVLSDYTAGYPLMFVPQGRSEEQLEASVRWFISRMSPANEFYFGIPRWITNRKEIATRQTITQYITKFCDRWGYTAYIHQLGMSDYFLDDITSSRMPNVMGIDSANPLVLGQIYGKSLEQEVNAGKKVHHSREAFFSSTVAVPQTIANIDFVRRMLNHGD